MKTSGVGASRSAEPSGRSQRRRPGGASPSPATVHIVEGLVHRPVEVCVPRLLLSQQHARPEQINEPAAPVDVRRACRSNAALTRRRCTPNISKNSVQNVWDSPRSLLSDSQAAAKRTAASRMSLRLGRSTLRAYDLSPTTRDLPDRLDGFVLHHADPVRPDIRSFNKEISPSQVAPSKLFKELIAPSKNSRGPTSLSPIGAVDDG